MHPTSFLALFASLLPMLLAQSSIDPSTVDDTTKEKWCNDQKSSCPLLCLQIPGATQTPKENGCTPDTLVYSCICSNGQQPNASEYSQTIPYYECTEAATQCVNNCASGDSSCQSACRNDNPCGAQNPTRINTSTMSTMAATSTGAALPSFTGRSGAEPNVQALTLGFGRTYGLAMILVGLIAGIMLVL